MADNTINLTIFGKGIEVEKMQKRLSCAARATGTELQLSWQHKDPQTLNIGAENSTAVTCNSKLVLDGLKPTEEIEILLTRLKG
jgi:hypothetical protein